MTGYETTAAAGHVYTEVLPPGADGTPAAVRWWTPDAIPGRGVLRIDQRRATATYVVAEYATEWAGRAVRLVKLDAGTDPGEAAYDVFTAMNGQDHLCDCKGHSRWGRCKHVSAVEALILNGWLDLSPVNPDADVTSTEVFG